MNYMSGGHMNSDPMRDLRIASLLAFVAIGTNGCSPEREAECGATPQDFCSSFRKLNVALGDRERADVISLSTAPQGETSGFDKLVDRAELILRLGRNDAVLTFLHENRVDDNRRAHKAILCGYAEWLKSGYVRMDSLLQEGHGTCWWVPQPIELPAVDVPPVIIDIPPPPPPGSIPGYPGRFIPLGAGTK
jgi:hypothetical protein